MTKRQVECFERIKRQWAIDIENYLYEVTAEETASKAIEAMKALQRDIWFLIDRIDGLRRDE